MTAEEVLDKHILEFKKTRPWATFDDVPVTVFTDAMEDYHEQKLKQLKENKK